MRTSWAVLVAAGLAAGCAGGGFFGPPPAPEPQVEPVVLVAGLVVSPEDGTVLLPTVASLAADRGRQGVILRAEGIAPIQGFFAPELRAVGRGEDGIEVLELRALPPPEVLPVGATPTRILSVGRFFTNREMREIRGFRVVAGQNALSVAAPAAPAPPPLPPPVF